MSTNNSDENNSDIPKGRTTRTYYDDEGKATKTEEYKEPSRFKNETVELGESEGRIVERKEVQPVKNSSGRLASIKEKLKSVVPKKPSREERIKRLHENIEETGLKADLAGERARLSKHNKQVKGNAARIISEAFGGLDSSQSRGRSNARRSRPAGIGAGLDDGFLNSGFSGLDSFFSPLAQPKGKKSKAPAMSMDMVSPEEFYGSGNSGGKKKKGQRSAREDVRDFYGF